MSITKRTIVVELTEKTWKCDFCDFQLVTTTQGFGRGMTSCHVCKKDACGKHVHWFQEDTNSDYADARVCPDCQTRFQEAWDWAKANAGRYESLMDIVDKRLALRR